MKRFYLFCLCCISAVNRFTNGETVTLGITYDDVALVPFVNPSVEFALETEAALYQEREEPLVIELQPITIEYPGDALDTLSDVTAHLRNVRPIGLIGPFKSDAVSPIQVACDSYGVPQLLTRPDYLYRRDWTMVNLYPHHSVFTKVVMEILKLKEWTEFAILYEDPETLLYLDDVINIYNNITKRHLVVRQLNPSINGEDANYRELLRTLKKSAMTNFVVWCSRRSLEQLLKQAQQVGIMAYKHSYIIVQPDLHTLDLEPYCYGGVNVTGVRLYNPEDDMAVQVAANLRRKLGRRTDVTAATLPSSLVLSHDGAALLARAAHRLNRTAFSGTTLLNYMRTSVVKGISGDIKFDEDGYRSDVTLQIVGLTEDGLQSIGVWNLTSGLTLEWPQEKRPQPQDDTSMKNKTFVVLTALTNPYAMLTESTEKLVGNARYEGFCIDLFRELARLNEFNIEFRIQVDKEYGKKNKTTGEWDGMIGELLRNGSDVDFAIVDLTITEEREKAVDFTTPFMNLGISILYRKPTRPLPQTFSFLLPFSNEVWLYLGISFLGVSILLYVLGRLSPDEWQNPYPCVEEPEALENQFTLLNAFWFNLGALLQQGSEIAPIAYGSRTLASIWWTFSIVMTSYYTANLASLLTKNDNTNDFETIHELAEREDIAYGTKIDGATWSFFHDSKEELYKKMFAHMQEHMEDQYPASNQSDAINRVLQGKYAFFMESVTIEYLTERNCQLVKIGPLLDNKGYGIAMRKGSKYLQKMNLALLRLQEDGTISSIKDTWWKEKRGGGACITTETNEITPMSIANFRGLYYVLAVGCLIGLLISLLDLVYHVFKRSKERQLPFSKELKAELKLIFKFESNTKPYQLQYSDSGSDGDSQRALKTPSPDGSPGSSLGTDVASAKYQREGTDLSKARCEGDVASDRNEGDVGSARGRKARPSLRSAGSRRRSTQTIHNNSVRLARQSTKETAY